MRDNQYQENILKEVREFVKTEIKPFAKDFEEKEEVPRALIDKMAEKGYLAASLPEEYGGLGLDPLYYGMFTEEFGKVCSATRSLITVHTSLVAETILRWGSEEQKKEWLPKLARGEKIAAFGLTEPDVGTDAKSIQTTYKKEGDRYIINGKKRWITFGDLADVFIIIAADEGKTTAFLVEREFGVKTKRITNTLAGRASYIAEVELDHIEVPAKNVLGIEGGGFTYIVNTALDNGRYSIAWSGLAIAQACLEAMVSYSRGRKQFGKKICQFQLIKGMIGDAVTKIHAARALCVKAGKMRTEMNPDAVMETTIAKYFTSKIAMEISIDAVQVHGGNGISQDYPVERFFREAKVLEIIEGTSQIQQEIISSYGLREYYVR